MTVPRPAIRSRVQPSHGVVYNICSAYYVQSYLVIKDIPAVGVHLLHSPPSQQQHQHLISVETEETRKLDPTVVAAAVGSSGALWEDYRCATKVIIISVRRCGGHVRGIGAAAATGHNKC